jgi:hypothetical protein
MRARRVTKWFVIVAIGVIAVFDTLQLAFHGYDSTISKALRDTAYLNPVVPFIFGFLMSHLFWSGGAEDYGKKKLELPPRKK